MLAKDGILSVLNRKPVLRLSKNVRSLLCMSGRTRTYFRRVPFQGRMSKIQNHFDIDICKFSPIFLYICRFVSSVIRNRIPVSFVHYPGIICRFPCHSLEYKLRNSKAKIQIHLYISIIFRTFAPEFVKWRIGYTKAPPTTTLACLSSTMTHITI